MDCKETDIFFIKQCYFNIYKMLGIPVELCKTINGAVNSYGGLYYAYQNLALSNYYKV